MGRISRRKYIESTSFLGVAGTLVGKKPTLFNIYGSGNVLTWLKSDRVFQTGWRRYSRRTLQYSMPKIAEIKYGKINLCIFIFMPFSFI